MDTGSPDESKKADAITAEPAAGWRVQGGCAYPNRLAEPAPLEKTAPASPLLLLALVVLCLLPRALMALRTDILCTDGTFYIGLAQRLHEGHLGGGLAEIHLNTLPVLLVLLHRLGLGWELAGKLLSVTASTLAVLPLFGLARRQFDTRVALVTCFLYIAHPVLIEQSHEVIRDPVFWLVYLGALYLLWRAVTEVRAGLFVLAGLAITVAALSRIEGLFLLIPLAAWSASRWIALKTARWRLVGGVAACVAVFPLLLVIVNVTWLRDHPQWEFFRLRPFALLADWLSAHFGLSPAVADLFDEGPLNSQHATTMGQMAWGWVHTMERGLSPVFALLMLGGLGWYWRIWLRSDHRPLFFVSLAIMMGMWIHLWHTQGSSHRYPLPIVLTGSMFAALALLALNDGFRELGRRWRWGDRFGRITVVSAFVAVGGVGISDALTSDFTAREGRARLGRWIEQQFGPTPLILGREDVARLTAYYAPQADCRLFPKAISEGDLIDLARQIRPDVILLSVTFREARQYTGACRKLETLGFVRGTAERLPPGCEGILVFVRPGG